MWSYLLVGFALVAISQSHIALSGEELKDFIQSATDGKTDVVKAFLDRGAYPSAENEDNKSVLELATAKGNNEIVKLLLDAGANTKGVNYDSDGNVQPLLQLMTRGARTKDCDRKGR